MYDNIRVLILHDIPCINLHMHVLYLMFLDVMNYYIYIIIVANITRHDLF